MEAKKRSFLKPFPANTRLLPFYLTVLKMLDLARGEFFQHFAKRLNSRFTIYKIWNTSQKETSGRKQRDGRIDARQGFEA